MEQLREISTEGNNVSKHTDPTIQKSKRERFIPLLSNIINRTAKFQGATSQQNILKRGKRWGVVEAQNEPEIYSFIFQETSGKYYKSILTICRGYSYDNYLFLQTSGHLKNSHCCATKQTTWKPFPHSKWLLKIFYILGNSECFTHKNKSFKLAGERTLSRWRT